MSEILFYYQRPEPATWVYLSSFMVLGVFFMFHRLWSLRNLDILLLILLAPGLMLVYEGRKLRIEGTVRQESGQPSEQPANLAESPNFPISATGQFLPSGDLQIASSTFLTATPYRGQIASQDPAIPATSNAASVAVPPGSDSVEPGLAAVGGFAQDPGAESIDGEVSKPSSISADTLEFTGFLWLLSVCGLLLIRLILDPTMVRRPLLEPNMTSGGLGFTGIALFLFLMANVITSTSREQVYSGPRLGPGYDLLEILPEIQTIPLDSARGDVTAITNEQVETAESAPSMTSRSKMLINLARLIAILANLAIVTGMVAVGYWHFDNVKMGIGAATLFLLLPYTSQMTGRADHMLPAALLVAAILFYRYPFISGCMLGCAAGLVYYPFFLLPLWFSFYWQRGIGRFLLGIGVTLFILCIILLLAGRDAPWSRIQQMFGLWLPYLDGLQGVWGLGWNPVFRLPVLIAFIIFSGLFLLWPAQKNLGTLMSGSAAIMVAAQFWHGFGGGLYMAWFLPLLLLTIFRPNLEDRLALEVVSRDWWQRKKPILPSKPIEEIASVA